MSLAKIKPHSWSNKPVISKPVFYATSLAIAAVVAFFRMRPYLDGKKVTIVFGHARTTAAQKANGTDMHHSDDLKGTSINHERTSVKGADGTRGQNYLIERALFDGKIVNVRALLTRSLSSENQNPVVEVHVIGGALGFDFDTAMLSNAQLAGTATPNFESKRFIIQFSQLTLENGKRYAVDGFAASDDDLAGVPAQYNSGLAKRVAGAVLGRAIQVSDDLLATQAFKSAGDEGVAAAEINRNLYSTTQQTGTGISQDVTKDFNATRPQLSLPAGTVFSVRLQAAPSTQGGTHE